MLQHLAVELRTRRLASAGVAQEHSIEEKR